MPNIVLTICLRYIYQGFNFDIFISSYYTQSFSQGNMYFIDSKNRIPWLLVQRDQILPNMPMICYQNYNFLHQNYRDYLEVIVGK